MRPDSAARHILRTLGAGPCLVIGDAGAPLVRALLGYGVDVTCHAPGATIVAAGNAATPGRFTQGAPDEAAPSVMGRANLVFVNALDAIAAPRLRKALAHYGSVARAGMMIVTDDEAGTPEPRPRAWWEACCIESGWRLHPRGLQLREARQMGLPGIVLLCEALPRAGPGTAPAARDPLRSPGVEAEAFMARYAWATRWIKLGDTVLDAFCGTGAGSWMLTRLTKAARVLATDPDPQAIAYAERMFRSPRLDVIPGDLLQMLADLPADSVDCIVAYDGTGQTDGKAPLLRAFHRVLTPAGRLILGERPPSGKPRQSRPGLLQRAFLVDVAGYQAANRTGIDPFDPAGPWPADAADWVFAVGSKPFVEPPLPGFRHRFQVEGSPVRIHANDFPAMLDNPWLQRGLLDRGMRPADPSPLRGVCAQILAGSGPMDQAAALTILGYRLAEDRILPALQCADHLSRIEDWIGRHLHRADEAQVTRWLLSLSFLGGILTLRTGDLPAAIGWFERCLAIDAARFGPLLFTKTVEAAHRLGWLHYGQENLPEARRAWICGIDEARRALALQHDAAAHPLANRLPFVFDEYAAICDMATRCTLALSHIGIGRDGLDLGPVMSRPRERCPELEAELASVRRQLAEVRAAPPPAAPGRLARLAQYFRFR